MKKITLASLLLFVSFVPSFNLAHAGDMDDAQKIKDFENQLNTSSPRKTRAIVMDKNNDISASANIANCGTIQDDSKAVAVDFSIQFKAGKAEIASSSEGTLRQISRVLALTPDRCILVEGHSDASGNFNTNMDLSKDRAAAVVKFIVDKSGMDKSRFVPIGKGSTEPLKNLDPRDAKNRRVVFKVIG